MTERELLPVAAGPRIRSVLLDLLRQAKGRAIGSFAFVVGATAIGLLTAPLLGRVVDLVATRQSAAALGWPVAGLVLVAATSAITTAIGVSMLARLGETMLADLRERFIDRALGLPLEQVEKAGSGDLTTRVTNDVSVVADAVRQALPALARSVLTIVLTLVAMAILDWRFLVAALLAVPIQLHTVRWYVRRATPLYAAQRAAVGAQQQQLLDTIGGAKTVRAFRLADAHVDRVRERSNGAVELALRGVRLATRFYGRLNLAEFVGLSAVLAAGFLLVGANLATVGVATAAALYFHSLFGPINTALALVDDAQAATASLSRLIGVTDLPSPAEPTRVGPPVDASVKAAGIGHSYVDDHPVLREVDLEVAPGERVAMVGASGAGKTTLAKLIAGIHQATSGTVSIGGVPLDQLGPAATRRAVALISQEVHVFSGSLADDLRLAAPEAGDEDLHAALAKVGAAEWVEALPDGLATVVGEGGHRLTVTQAQQLALVRLVLADPPVAILDEATAEAGSAGAKTLESAAAAALEGRTGLIVAHRLTQAAASDRIVVLDSGVVVESGTHDELVAAGGRYATLWTAWSGLRGHRW
ncbi:ABC transporter ATP-binding protein [Amycolatopsis rubida]|uniref:ABC transporter ATP-binding protein n=1 Tax=Amycolatopsis rubida TaxID=112413 RepID=A0A1I6AJV8_9PSEU|nr:MULTISPECIES: ABC transporter ATP-binding protein [Amycolatopsis]MYW89833.1 ATP-binding cassette domain-containing protein [Amycolatopsis rubida]NEC54810.1 ABC transporter ATP-binding protein [Amycolatopsis rubida]OAP23183.1 putative multidrug export ATP-binding/permease protein [Amycolatopsis sp. M39]SFQ68994.1 ATP-binding cassette, subfamily C [Amycolatopsis rubida]